MIKCFVIVACSLFTIQSILPTTETFTVSQNIGQFSPIITADETSYNTLSKYGICGFSFRQMIYTKKTYSCGCRFNTCNGKRICDWCDTQYKFKTNALKIHFCLFNETDKYLTKTFETGNINSGVWRDIMCPPGMVVEKYSARFGGSDGQTIIGLNGFQLKCVTPYSQTRASVMDNYTFPLSALSNNSQGTAATAVSVKFEQNGMLTGIRMYFEPYNLVISQIDISYGTYTLIGPQTSKIIETAIKSNTNPQMTAQNVQQKFTLSYTSSSNFTNDQTTYDNFRIQSSVTMQPPALILGNTQESIFYMKVYSNAQFKNNVTITYTPYKALTLPLDWCIQVVSVSQVIEQWAKVPYVMKLTFINPATRAIVKTQIVSGIWQGMLKAPITTATTYPEIPGCKND